MEQEESVTDGTLGRQVSEGGLSLMDLLLPCSPAHNAAGVNQTQTQVQKQQLEVQQQAQLQQQAQSQAYSQAMQAQTQAQAEVVPQARIQQQQQSGGGVSQAHLQMSPSAMGLVTHPYQMEAKPLSHSDTPGIVDSSAGGSMYHHISADNTITNAVGGGGASSGVRQEQRHMHTMHPYQMESKPSLSHTATPGIVYPSAGGSMYHHISADIMTTSATACPPPFYQRGLCTPPHGVGIDLYSHVSRPFRGLNSSNHSTAPNSSNSSSAGGMRFTHSDLANVWYSPTTQFHEFFRTFEL